jgi:hypothetical protein
MNLQIYACRKCLDLQRISQPTTEPSCGLQEKMGSINVPSSHAGLEFGRGIEWAEGNICPKSEIQSLGQVVYQAIHPGRRFIYIPRTINSDQGDIYENAKRRELKELSSQRKRRFNR